MLDFFWRNYPKFTFPTTFHANWHFFAGFYWKFDGFLQSSGAKLWLIYLFLADKTMSHASQTQKKLILKISVGHIFRIPPVIFNVRLSFMCFFSLSTLVIAIFNNISLPSLPQTWKLRNVRCRRKLPAWNASSSWTQKRSSHSWWTGRRSKRASRSRQGM